MVSKWIDYDMATNGAINLNPDQMVIWICCVGSTIKNSVQSSKRDKTKHNSKTVKKNEKEGDWHY